MIITNYYVSTTGSNSNDGLTASTPFLTIQRAFDEIAFKVLNQEQVVINVASGAYPDSVTIWQPWVGGLVTIEGNNAHLNVTNNDAISIDRPIGILLIKNLKISSGTGYGIRHDAQGLVEIDNVDFATCAYAHMKANAAGSIIRAVGNYKISGGALVHMEARFGGLLETRNRTVNITGTPHFGYYFAVASRMGTLDTAAMTFSGSATGARYIAYANGTIWTNGAGANYFPGNAAGTVQTEGCYV